MDATPVAGDSRGKSWLARLRGLPALVRQWWSESQFPAPAESESAASAAGPGLFSLVLIAVPLLLLNLSYPLLEPDENRNAQISLEMFQSGDYVVPTRNGHPYLYKPPLLFWLVSASYGLFGVREWAARLPVALAALATVLATYELGRSVVGQRAAWLGAICLLLTGGFVLAGRFLLMDVLLTMCTTIGLLAAYAGGTGQHRRLAWWLVAGAACGIGILAKGPVALVLVVPPLIAAAWLSPQHFSLRWRDGALLVGTALMIALPWYILVTQRHPEFPEAFLLKQNLQRYTTGIDHEQPWWFYIPVLFLGMLPASILFPALAVFLASRNEAIRRLRSPGLGFLALAAGWVVCFFSLSSSKLPTYILPAIPCVCLLLGRLIDAVLLPVAAASATPLSGLLRWTNLQFPRLALIGWGLLGFGGAAADVVVGTDAWPGLVISVVVGAISLALLAAAVLNRLPNQSARWSLAGGAALVAMTLGFNDLYPEIAARRSHLLQARAEVAAARQLARSERVPVVLYGTLSESTSFYMDEHGLTRFATDQYDDLVAFSQTHPRILLISTPSNAASLAQSLPVTFTLADDPAQRFVFEMVNLRISSKRSLAQRPAAHSR